MRFPAVSLVDTYRKARMGDYQGYRRGDLPVSEAVHPNTVSLPTLIDPAPDYLEQYIAVLEKVTEHASDLL